nr:hypothetical protein [Tanacetum cinerariifolium]
RRGEHGVHELDGQQRRLAGNYGELPAGHRPRPGRRERAEPRGAGHQPVARRGGAARRDRGQAAEQHGSRAQPLLH